MIDLFTKEAEKIQTDGPLKKALLKVIEKKRYLPDREAKTKSTKELQNIITKIESNKIKNEKAKI